MRKKYEEPKIVIELIPDQDIITWSTGEYEGNGFGHSKDAFPGSDDA